MDYAQPGTTAQAFARPPDRAGELVVRHEDKSFADNGQLTVDHNECAAFVRDGALVGTLGPGRHTLSAQMFPFLGNLRDPTTAQYRAELYFVTSSPVSGMRFGGRAMLNEPSGRTGNATIFGEYTVRVTDPGCFLTQVAGQSDLAAIGGLFGQTITPHVERCAAAWLLEGYYTLDNIAQAGPHLAQAVAPHCGGLASYGVALVSIDNVMIKVG